MFLGPYHHSCFVSCVTLKRCWIPFSIQQAKKCNFLALAKRFRVHSVFIPRNFEKKAKKIGKKSIYCERERERNDYAIFYDWKGGKKFFAIHAINFTPSWFFIWKYGCSGVLESKIFCTWTQIIMSSIDVASLSARFIVSRYAVDKSYGRYCALSILMSRLEINKCHGLYWHICHCLQHLVMNEQCECQFCN